MKGGRGRTTLGEVPRKTPAQPQKTGSAFANQPHIQLEALHTLARALAGGEFRARSILERACAAVAGGFGFQRVGILRYVPETSTIVPFASHGLTATEVNVLPPSLSLRGQGALERALASGRACYVSQPTDEDLSAEVVQALGLGSFVIVPLFSEGRCLGFMTCDMGGAPFALDPAEIDLLTTFGALIAAFLEKAIAHGELRRLNEQQAHFAALASHELRTPVAAIFGAAKTLERHGTELSPEQRALLNRMLSEQSQRLQELVENLLDLSRLEADAIRIEPAPLLVTERLEELTARAFDDGEVVVDAAVDLSAVVDSYAFDRIVSNLLSNARRHGAPPVLIGAGRSNGELWVTVEDRGTGISPDFVGHLFDRFTRGPTGASEGAGLGLSIAQTYARAHGGSLRYEPAVPRGARFRLVLPAGEEA